MIKKEMPEDIVLGKIPIFQMYGHSQNLMILLLVLSESSG